MYSCGLHKLPENLQKENQPNTPLKRALFFFKITIIQLYKTMLLLKFKESLIQFLKTLWSLEACEITCWLAKWYIANMKRTNVLILSKNRLSQFPQTWCPSCLETAWQSVPSSPWNHDAGGSTLPSQWPSRFPRRPRKAWSTSMKRRLPLFGSCTA